MSESLPPLPRLGLIGAGRWGRTILRCSAGLGDAFRLAAVASANPETAALVPPGCAVHADWRAMMDCGELDGVVIATPPASHAELALAAIESGIAVLVEKPLTRDPAEARAVAAAAHARGVAVMVDHIHLYSPAFRRLVELVPTLGAVRAIRSRAGNRGPYRVDTSVLWDWGPHDAAMTVMLAGATPERMAVRRSRHGVVEGVNAENIDWTLTFAGGVTATTTIGTMMDRCRVFAVHCEAGVLVYDDLASDKLRLYPPQPADQSLPTTGGRAVAVGDDRPLDRVLRDFAAVAAGQAADDGLRLGVDVVCLLARLDKLLEQS